MATAHLVFDPFSEQFFTDPYPTYRRMREEAPVYYDERHDFYALTRHEDVSAAFKDYQTYSSARGIDLAMVKNNALPQESKSMIFMDPPEHRRMRTLVNKVFTPRAITSLKDTVTELIEYHLSRIDPHRFDVVADFSALFPVEVISTVLGVPAEHRQQIRHWVDTSLHREPGQIEMGEVNWEAVTQIGTFYYNLIQERRKAPQDDMISGLIAAEVEREGGGTTQLDDFEITGFATLLGGAGAETVTKLVGNAIVQFARNPDQWQKLLDDRAKVPAAIEEVLRYEAPAQYNVRCSLKDVALHGVTIPAGKPVFLLGGSANRDPNAFTDADKFDIDRDRTEAQNLGFGYGVHSCLGAALARLESAIALNKLLDLMPRYEVIWDDCKRVSMQNVAGWSNVPVRVLP
ncbi:cytochrome P450 [Mycobacterium montefiorense]|uniref:Cytochrome P450 n=1 Tax=Mycobacterium montefiorense TaxID=154654 RepID=A0AA37UVZ9_9MYCO|nr:cytochrome P450 [Mycobacterium montefiorense]GBG36283.1 cytochrome P450 [Mycobacterium montefiorense]GKU32948.1 cytochrome P450 [Mycobacterium montefiorense]GKU38582.1 cytochrome P450 [Mycobacterium montefiorense]GKU46651.1 cytochrome P450 [Mycobacterium montefiorense]GKU51576.1 cytochrome P450 [Mycobacterium montefiorense]